MVLQTENTGANLQTATSAEKERPLTAPSGGPRRARQGRERLQAAAAPPASASAGHGHAAEAQEKAGRGQPKRERGVSARVVEERLDELRADDDFRSEAGTATAAAIAMPLFYRRHVWPKIWSGCFVSDTVRVSLGLCPLYAISSEAILEGVYGTMYLSHGPSPSSIGISSFVIRKKRLANLPLNTSLSHQNGVPM